MKCPCGATLSPPPDGRRHRCAGCGLIHDRQSDYYGPTAAGTPPKERSPEEPFDAYRVDWPYSPDDLERIRWGLTPADMGDKWCACLEGEEIFFFRSWSGLLCYKLRVTPTGIDQVRIARSVPKHDWHLTVARWLVEYKLVGRDWPFPKGP